jgi:hypothetical protein
MLAAAAVSAHADPGQKPGLWEMKINKTVVDGHDQSAQLAGLSAKMQEQMARLTPEQRAQMGAMMQQYGAPQISDSGAIRLCVTPEMAKRDVPVVDKDGACETANVSRSGNRMTYEVQCTKEGHKVSGTGEMIRNGDQLSVNSDTTVVERGQTHQIHTEMEMKFISSDCGNVKPLGAGAGH